MLALLSKSLSYHQQRLHNLLRGGRISRSLSVKTDSKDFEMLPKFADVKIDSMKEKILSELETLNKNFKSYELVLSNPVSLGSAWGTKRLEYDYEMVIEELEKIQAPLSFSWGLVGHLMGVKNSLELRSVHDELQPQIIDCFQKIGQSKPLYNALNALRNRASIWRNLSSVQQRIVDQNIKQMKDSGIGLEAEKQILFNNLSSELAELSTKFGNNILDSTKAYKLLITNKIDVDGLPTSALALASQAANQFSDSKTSTPENGPWLLTLDMPSYLPAMQHLKNRDIREKLYKAYVARSSEFAQISVVNDGIITGYETTDKYDNTPIINKILLIKKQLANLLGHQNHAERSLSKKMAKSIDSVMELTNMLHEKAYPAALRELKEVEDFAKSTGFKESNVALWDVPYYSERLREKLYQYSDEEIRPYFRFDVVLQGLFDLSKRLFGVTIKEATAEDNVEVWNEHVKLYKIYDDKNNNEHIASFYVDPFSRPAEKKGGAWMDICLGRSSVLNRKPVAYLICNGSPPVNGISLMSFREVETLYHEWGHTAQHCLTKIDASEAAGINMIEWDAVELPSQMLENWCYDKKTLYGFANHYETGEKLPLEYYNKIKAAKNFQSGMQMIRQLFFSTMDLTLYSSYDPSKGSIYDVQHELAKKYTVIPPLPTDRFLCSFGHIFAGGYSSGYYSYKWAEVMSSDAFSAFEEVGLENESEVVKTGLRFRDTILSLGGSKPAIEVFTLFRGRPPKPDALLEHSGLLSSV